MSTSPIKPQQLRAEKTRQKLIEATIECLAKYGYAGSQLGLISDIAGVSRRPRQYYFPTRTSLMSEVWHDIRRYDDANFDSLVDRSQPLSKTVDMIVDYGIDKYKTARYLADLHLKIAVRSDEELRAELSPHMEMREAQADDTWVNVFSELDIPKSQLVAIRYLHVSLLRGLAIEYICRSDLSHLSILEEEFRRTMHASLT